MKHDPADGSSRRSARKSGEKSAGRKKKMIRHVILWKLKDEFDEAEKTRIKTGIKTGLEGLAGKIPGLVSITVDISGISGSTADAMLDSTFADEAALRAYSGHPAHTAVAESRVRPFVRTRLCLDFEV